MKTLVGTLFIVLIACTSTPKKNPECNIVIVTQMGPVLIEEGFFDNKDNYWTEKEWDAEIQKQRRLYQKQLEEYLNEGKTNS